MHVHALEVKDSTKGGGDRKEQKEPKAATRIHIFQSFVLEMLQVKLEFGRTDCRAQQSFRIITEQNGEIHPVSATLISLCTLLYSKGWGLAQHDQQRSYVQFSL